MAIDPVTLSLIGAGIGGIGSYWGGQGNKQAAEEQAALSRESLAYKKWKDEQDRKDLLASKESARGVLGGMDVSGYGGNLNYVNPYQSAVDTSLNAFLSGKLTDAEVTQQGKDIATAGQTINAGAATMGLPAGARAGLLGQSTSDITGNYANIASGRIGTGIGLATSAAGTGANIANMNYSAGLQKFLAEQQAKNQQAQLLASYS